MQFNIGRALAICREAMKNNSKANESFEMGVYEMAEELERHRVELQKLRQEIEALKKVKK